MNSRAGLFEKRGPFTGTAALLACALICGGLGPHAPFLNALIQAAAFVLLVGLLAFDRAWRPVPREGVAALLLIVALLAIGVAQCIPLPAPLWRALPGRDVPAMVLETLGQANGAWPLSLSPDDTRQSLLAFLPPIAVFVATMLAGIGERLLLARVIVLVAAASSLLGLIQLVAGDGSFFLYPTPPYERFPGLFANFNHQALFLACAVTLLPVAVRGRDDRKAMPILLPAFWTLLLFGAVATASRTGLALFALASCGSLLWMPRAARDRRRPTRPAGGRRLLPLLLTVAALAGAAAVLASSYRAQVMLDRFAATGHDPRREFWPTTWTAMGSYFPAGAGLGTFAAAYQISEPLETVQTVLINHAHNDFMEFVLEAGLAGLILILAFLLWFGSRLFGLRRQWPEFDPFALAGAMIVALVLVHSVVDYPLRTEAIGCVFAFACALLVAAPVAEDARRRVRLRSVRA